MSRIGNLPIIIPAGVTVEVSGHHIKVNGPKGALELKFAPEIKVEVLEGKVIVKRKNDLKKSKALHGFTRSLIANMIAGVTEGWSKNLELVGVGFRAQASDNKLVLNVGFSHPVEIEAPPGINFEVLDNTRIKVSGTDKQLVGQVAANIKKVRPPDVYKGKGIRFEGEYIRKKVGKSAKVGAAGAAGAK
ncbi:MAG: large subunit ribosomal protein L6 [Microgenomates group bacterium Gr01-1014_7]|nr:MAG: large subunit ribosomal protein L6 [Microgenomates group bacterium Gr01-1014_7]